MNFDGLPLRVSTPCLTANWNVP